MGFFHVEIALFVSIKTRSDFATSADSKISGFARPHGSKLFADSKISTLESGFKKLRICMRIRRISVDERRIWKEKVADSKISGYVSTGLNGMQFVRVQTPAYFGVFKRMIVIKEISVCTCRLRWDKLHYSA